MDRVTSHALLTPTDLYTHGYGHWSPLAAYSPATDAVLVLDVARCAPSVRRPSVRPSALARPSVLRPSVFRSRPARLKPGVARNAGRDSAPPSPASFATSVVTLPPKPGVVRNAGRDSAPLTSPGGSSHARLLPPPLTTSSLLRTALGRRRPRAVWRCSRASSLSLACSPSLRYDVAPWWVSLKELHSGMATHDPASNKNRGYVVIG